MHQFQPLPDDEWMRWLPPSPHREALLDFLARARATLIPRGDDQAPLVQFEDGGLMELDRIRYDEGASFYHAADPTRRTRGDEFRATQYGDVCGSIDEMKRVLAEGPEAIGQRREYLASLLDDALYMERRMSARQQQYREFAEGIASLMEGLAAEGECAARAVSAAEELRAAWESDPAAADVDRLNELAEEIRDVANRQETGLRQSKALAIEVLHAYEAIKGPRNWSDEESGHDDAAAAPEEATTTPSDAR